MERRHISLACILPVCPDLSLPLLDILSHPLFRRTSLPALVQRRTRANEDAEAFTHLVPLQLVLIGLPPRARPRACFAPSPPERRHFGFAQAVGSRARRVGAEGGGRGEGLDRGAQEGKQKKWVLKNRHELVDFYVANAFTRAGSLNTRQPTLSQFGPKYLLTVKSHRDFLSLHFRDRRK